jgi:hypothetical protein
VSPKELQDLLDELEASRASRKRAWENLAEIRWVIKDTCGIDLPPPAQKTFDAEGEALKHALTNLSGFGTKPSKVCLCRSADFGTPPSKKNAKAIIRMLSKHSGKRWIGRRI